MFVLFLIGKWGLEVFWVVLWGYVSIKSFFDLSWGKVSEICFLSFLVMIVRSNFVFFLLVFECDLKEENIS